ncbi:MAG: hypothetical protein ACREH8_12320 [Opitutaceae bacterium]
MNPVLSPFRAACAALVIAAWPLASFAAQTTSAPASAAESNTKRSFDIPSGPAASTFKQFIAQSRVQVMFVADDVAPVRTKALKGEFQTS